MHQYDGLVTEFVSFNFSFFSCLSLHTFLYIYLWTHIYIYTYTGDYVRSPVDDSPRLSGKMQK